MELDHCAEIVHDPLLLFAPQSHESLALLRILSNASDSLPRETSGRAKFETLASSQGN
jgi:hypothetical protein